MKELFEKDFKLETKSLRSLNKIEKKTFTTLKDLTDYLIIC